MERRIEMKKRFLLALSLAAAPVAVLLSAPVPAAAQTSTDQRRWEDAQARYRAEFENYLRERDRYIEARVRDRYGSRGDYRGSYDNGARDPFATDYDAARYYRDSPQYRERVLTDNDEVYRGSDGRYYCKRSDGTTGLIIGGAGGAVLGNVLDGGRNRAAGTLIGGALGALLGRSVEQSQQDYRCR
jgi:glycine zipper 2TM protein